MAQREKLTNTEAAQVVTQGSATNKRRNGDTNSSSSSIETKIAGDINNNKVSKKMQAMQVAAQGTATDDRKKSNANSSSSYNGDQIAKNINNISKNTGEVSDKKDSKESIAQKRKTTNARQ